MAVKETFAMSHEAAMAYVAEELDDLADVQIKRNADAAGPIFEVYLPSSSVFRRNAEPKLHARLGVREGGDEHHTVVVLQDVDSPPWLYRKLLRIVETPSTARQEAEAARRESPFSMENMWGMGPDAASAPREKGLGFGGDFFGGPKSRRPPKDAIAAQAADTVDDPGAFTIARDNGDF